MQDYRSVIDKYFFLNVQASLNNRMSVDNVKDDYRKIIENENANNEIWLNFIDTLQLKYPYFHIRDLRNWCQPHSLQLIFTFYKQTKAVALNVSFLENLIGFYFIDNDIYQPKNIIYDQNGKMIPFVSYIPLSEEHIHYKEQLLKIVKGYFKEFSEFDNKLAAETFYDIKVLGTHYKKISLFQLLFCDEVFGIF